VPDPRRWLILAICCMSLFIVGLDNTAVNVALPDLRADLDATTSQLQWTVSAYTLVLASLLMLSGSTADRIGRARVFKAGLTIFSVGSLLCSIAPNVHLLIVARMIQAIGGSMLNPVAMSIIRNTFEDPRERAQAIGLWAGVIGVSMALGPLVGGGLTEGNGWRAIFWINVPVGIAAFILTTRFIPESKAPRARRIDPVGQVLVIALLGSAVYAIIEAPAAGWLSVQTLAFAVVAIAALAALIAYEPRRQDPLIDTRFFKSAPFAGASLIAILTFAALGGFLFLNTIYLQSARGLSPFMAGVYTLPMAAMTVVVGPITGRMVGRFGARPSLLIGGAAIGISSLMLVDIAPGTSVPWLFAAYIVFGIGFGAVNPPITNTAVSGMPPAQAGVASAVASTSRQTGQSIGVAVFGSVAVSAAGASPATITDASHVGYWIVVGCGAVIVGLAWLSTGAWAQATAVRTAALLSESSCGRASPS
jgi:EmrB/QacA subfamily drug resistance transporter